VDVCAGHRELRRTKTEERVAECVDFVAVDVRDGAGGAHLEIAADERHTDSIAFAKGTGHPALGDIEPLALSAPNDGSKASGAEGSREELNRGGLEPAQDERRGDRPEHRAQLRSCGLRKAEDLNVARPARKGLQTAECRLQRRREALTRDGEVDSGLLRWDSLHHLRRVRHLGNRRDAGDRLRRERSDRVRDRADQPSVDEDRAAAHACGHARFCQRAAFEARENQVAIGPLDVSKHPDDRDFELLQVRAFEHRAPDARHAGLDFFERHQGRHRRQGYPAEDSEREGRDGSADIHMDRIRKGQNRMIQL
jgi:hypothetical protein